jgi:hypothetical protein
MGFKPKFNHFPFMGPGFFPFPGPPQLMRGVGGKNQIGKSFPNSLKF